MADDSDQFAFVHVKTRRLKAAILGVEFGKIPYLQLHGPPRENTICSDQSDNDKNKNNDDQNADQVSHDDLLLE